MISIDECWFCEIQLLTFKSYFLIKQESRKWRTFYLIRLNRKEFKWKIIHNNYSLYIHKNLFIVNNKEENGYRSFASHIYVFSLSCWRYNSNLIPPPLLLTVLVFTQLTGHLILIHILLFLIKPVRRSRSSCKIVTIIANIYCTYVPTTDYLYEYGKIILMN